MENEINPIEESNNDSYSLGEGTPKPPISYDEYIKDAIELISQGKDEYIKQLTQAGIDNEEAEELWTEMLDDVDRY